MQTPQSLAQQWEREENWRQMRVPHFKMDECIDDSVGAQFTFNLLYLKTSPDPECIERIKFSSLDLFRSAFSCRVVEMEQGKWKTIQN